MKLINALGRFASEAARALRNFKYEVTDSGIYLPESRAVIGGVFRHAHAPANQPFGPWAVDPNRVVTEGLVYVLASAFAGSSQLTAYYIAPYSGNVTPAAGWTAANFATNSTEFLDYTAATRLPWTVVAPTTTPSVGNSAALAASTMTFSPGGPYNVYGLGLLSASTKNATTGKLIAATSFAVPRLNMVAGDKLALEYIISAADGS